MSKALHVFVDESGDLGFSEKSTKYIVMGAMATHEPLKVARIVRRVRERHLCKHRRYVPELKFSESSDTVKAALLKMLAEHEGEMWYVYLQKRDIPRLSKYPEKHMYNTLATEICKHIVKLPERKIIVKLDKALEKKDRERLKSHILEDMENTLLKLGRLSIDLQIEWVYSESEPCIQLVDFVCGAVFRKYEYGDSLYFDLIKHKVTQIEI
ncbi:MAG: DUF3800 domain-containing protein [Methanobacteriota archaeon]